MNDSTPPTFMHLQPETRHNFRDYAFVCILRPYAV